MSRTRSADPDIWCFPLFLPFLALILLASIASHASPTAETDEDVCARALGDLAGINLRALRMAIEDLMQSNPQTYTKGQTYLDALESFAGQRPALRQALQAGDAAAAAQVKRLVSLQRQALLANPLLDFDYLLLIKRQPLGGEARRARGDRQNDKGLGKFLGIPQQSSWQLQTIPNTDGWDNEIAVLSLRTDPGKLRTVFEPSAGRLVNELDLHYDGQRLMFSMPDERKHWQIFEMDLSTRRLRQISPPNQTDVHNFDSCYLPNERIAFISTAPFQGVPCNPSVNVGMTYVMNADGSGIRQLCFEQDHNYYPTVMNDGRIMYLRWEYTDIPHVWARFLFTMNPDGTGQREFYGSGSYWPNAIFFARPIPHHPTKIVGIVTGHHVGRVGELVIFDPARGRESTDGVVQRIPGYGQQVEPIIEDKLALDSWPKFLHPWPLSEKYFLVACKPHPASLWGIYLVDVFDNRVLLREEEGYALLEPLPWRKTQRPPVIAEMANPQLKDALIYMEDIYEGPGLTGVPRGTVKKLRLFTYYFAYHRVAGINHRVGADGPWEPKRILGTVPVEPDGSALFRVPANTPISIQPLDKDGKALQLMRSWLTAMPGEILSCVGCHEKQNAAPTNQMTVASRREPSEIKPWHGPVRGFSFQREVQPVLDKYCVGCHNGKVTPGEPAKPDLRGNQDKYIAYKNGVPRGQVISDKKAAELVTQYGAVFPPAYVALRSHVRVGGLESDLRLLVPGEFGAETCELIQMLQKGHHGVQLDKEAWERLFAWIDLNAPCHGTWREVVGTQKIENNHRRRVELRRLYGGDIRDPEAYPEHYMPDVKPVMPAMTPHKQAQAMTLSQWPFDAKANLADQPLERRTLDLGREQTMELVYIPAGEFIMGDAAGEPDEQPLTHARIDSPFWMACTEVTNEQYACFDADHDSRFQDKGSWMFNEWDLGWPLNQVRQPVIRVSCRDALAFCAWLSERTGTRVTLPTEAQWEWACRAGSDTAFSFGAGNTNYSAFANMGDDTLRDLAYDARDHFSPDLVPRDERFNDGMLVSAEVGSYQPNAWGLYDMHGNVWEWTRSAYAPYPYAETTSVSLTAQRVTVRGGSWYDRPKRCRSAFRLSFPAWQKVYNVGFRIVIEIKDTKIASAHRTQN